MKLTESKLRHIIREEISRLTEERVDDDFREAVRNGEVEKLKLYKQDFVDFLGSQVGENTYEHPYQTLDDLPFQHHFQTPPGYSSREEYIRRKGNDNPQDFVVKVRNERRMKFGKPRQHTRVKLIGRDTGSTAANTKVKPKPDEGLTYPDGYHTKIISGGRPLSKGGVRYDGPEQVVSRMLQGPFKGPLYF